MVDQLIGHPRKAKSTTSSSIDDGTGTLRGITTITTGLRWRAVQEPLVCQGAWDEGFVMQCRDLGSAMAAGLDMGIF